MSANRPSRMCQTGFQYTPVASIATCVHPALSSHSASANNPCVVVGKRRTSRSTFRLLIRRTQATTSALCTSRPAHLLCNVFIATSLIKARPAWSPFSLNSSYRVPGCIHPFGQIAIRWPQLSVLKGPPVKLIHGLARTKTTPTSAPTAAQLTLFHASGCAAPMATHSSIGMPGCLDNLERERLQAVSSALTGDQLLDGPCTND